MDKINFFPVPSLELLFTEQCNLKCTYCFERDKLNRKMPLETLLPLTTSGGAVSRSFYPFGGEPLLAIDTITEMIESILAQKDMNESSKKNMLQSLYNHITNGTLIKNNLDVIKKYKLVMQISLDGPKYVHDSARVYADGRGSFDDVYEAVKICSQEKIFWSVHGATGPENIKNLSEIAKFYFKLYVDFGILNYGEEGSPIDNAILAFDINPFQMLFEGEYTDDLIDELLLQFYLVADWIWTTTDYELTQNQRRDMFISWCTKRGSACVAGDIMLAVDFNYDLYPCHRVAMLPDRENFSLGSLIGEIRNFGNYEYFNAISQMYRDNCMFSSSLNVEEWNEPLYWMNWCPAANSESHNSPYYQPSKYNTLIAELNEFIPKLAIHYGVSPLDLEGKIENNLKNRRG